MKLVRQNKYFNENNLLNYNQDYECGAEMNSRAREWLLQSDSFISDVPVNIVQAYWALWPDKMC